MTEWHVASRKSVPAKAVAAQGDTSLGSGGPGPVGSGGPVRTKQSQFAQAFENSNLLL